MPGFAPAPHSATGTTRPARRAELILRPLGDKGVHVVKDPDTGAYYQLGPQESFLLTQLDGEQSAEAICAAFAERFGEPLSAEDLEEFLELARERNFLAPGEEASPLPSEEAVPSPDPADETQKSNGQGSGEAPPPPPPSSPKATPAPSAGLRQSLLYWRFRFFDPDRLFAWLAPWLRFLWTPGFLVVSAGCILLAACLAWTNRGELASHFVRALRWETILLAWLTLLAATACHEAAHGLTCKHFGGEVHEVGFLLLFFLPCFYCNVSDAWLFKEKSRRIWVTLAGGYCDLFLWALAILAWRLTPPESLPSYLAWVILSVLGARVFFNFNPLLKLDGYYLLSDWLEVPNLRQRAWGYLGGQTRWLLWGAPRPQREPRARLLLGYGLASWCFSLAFLVLMLVGFCQFLGGRWGLIGVGAVVLLGWGTLPGMFQVFLGGEVGKMIRFRWKRTLLWGLTLGAVPALLVFAKMEDQVGGPFELRALRRAEVRAPVAGFVKEVAVAEGDRIVPGQLVAQLEVPDLDSQVARKRAAVREAQARLRMLEEGPRYEEVQEARHRVERSQAWRDLARQDLDRFRRALREELVELDLQIARHQAEQEMAQEALERARELRARASLSAQGLRETQTKAKVAQAQIEEVRARKQSRQILGTQEAEMELARREKLLADAQASLRLLEAGTRPEEIEASRAALARLEEELRYLEGLQNKLPISSPIEGLVTTARVKEKVGQYLEEGDLITLIENPDLLEAEIAVPEQEIARVRPGQTVSLRVRGLPFETFRAEVVRVAPTTSVTEPSPVAPQPIPGELPGTVTVYCRLPAAPALRLGLTGHARISCGRRPSGAILVERMLRYVRAEFWW